MILKQEFKKNLTMILTITQDYKFRNRYFRFSIKNENVLMTRLILSKSFLPVRALILWPNNKCYSPYMPLQWRFKLKLRGGVKSKFDTI